MKVRHGVSTTTLESPMGGNNPAEMISTRNMRHNYSTLRVSHMDNKNSITPTGAVRHTMSKAQFKVFETHRAMSELKSVYT